MMEMASFVVVFLAAAPGAAFRTSSSRRLVATTRMRASDLYENWNVDLEAYEATRSDPLVHIDSSPGRGLGVFASRNIAPSTTITEWVGCLAPTPETVCEELELQQEYYGPDWRSYSQRYEIGLSGSRVVRAAGSALGGLIRDDLTSSLECDVEDDYESCVVRGGEGEFLLLGKVPEQGATPYEGVAQLINDHTALKAPAVSPLHSSATAKSAAVSGDGAIKPSDVDGLLIFDGRPIDADIDALERIVDHYISNIVPKNNVALVQAKLGMKGMSAPRVFAVATRPIPKGQELFYSYGLEWWLAQIRRAALAQLVSCRPSPSRASALAGLIRAVEQVSRERAPAQARAIAEAGSMPSRYVMSLDPLPPLDAILEGDENSNWQQALLLEELSMATECPVEVLYAQAGRTPQHQAQSRNVEKESNKNTSGGSTEGEGAVGEQATGR